MLDYTFGDKAIIKKNYMQHPFKKGEEVVIIRLNQDGTEHESYKVINEKKSQDMLSKKNLPLMKNNHAI